MSTPIATRELKAATSWMVIVEESPGLYDVYSDDRGPYTVDPDLGVCECPDHQYRNVVCKHRRRVEMALGERALPPVPDEQIDPLLLDARGEQ